MNCAVIIPTHKEKLIGDELEYFLNNISVLSNRDIILVCPKSLNVDFYIENGIKIFERFDDEWFKSESGYNDLMVSSIFYERFIKYDFILICQTDVYVFNDELDKWVDLNYDYVGAPWMVKIYIKKLGNLFNHVGNGGFSLRKVKTFYNLIKENQQLFIDARKLFLEDVIFSVYIKSKGFNISIPDYRIAAEFSFETNIDKCYNITNKLPFGCHKLSKNVIEDLKEKAKKQ